MLPTGMNLVSNQLTPPLPNATRDAAQQLESVLLAQVLKQMRATLEDGGLFPGDESDTFGGIFDMYLGQFVAEQDGLGLAASIENAIQSEPATPDPFHTHIKKVGLR